MSPTRWLTWLLLSLACLAPGVSRAGAAQNLPHFLRDYRANGAGNMRVTAFADGSIQDAIKGEGTPTGSGSVGIQMGLKSWVVQGNIAFTNTVGTVADRYGLSVLNPMVGGSTPSAMLELALPELLGPHYGVAGYLLLAQANWSRTSAGPQDTQPTTALANVVGAGALAYHSITGKLDENEVGLSFGLGLSARTVFGAADSLARATFLGRHMDKYGGLEGYFALTVNGVTAYSQIYGYGSSGAPGLTGMSAIFGVTLRANIFKLDIPRDASQRPQPPPQSASQGGAPAT